MRGGHAARCAAAALIVGEDVKEEGLRSQSQMEALTHVKKIKIHCSVQHTHIHKSEVCHDLIQDGGRGEVEI